MKNYNIGYKRNQAHFYQLLSDIQQTTLALYQPGCTINLNHKTEYATGLAKTREDRIYKKQRMHKITII